jgi:nucleotide-binding universal stress UspA family protein
MFKHILLPTDGVTLSDAMLQQCVTLAQENHATLTTLHVIPVYELTAMQSEAVAMSGEQFEEENQAKGRLYLDRVAAAARAAGVPCATLCVKDNHPHQAIIRVATDLGCDLITMVSHGRKGMAAVLLGSETHKVLINSRIPVLVYR